VEQTDLIFAGTVVRIDTIYHEVVKWDGRKGTIGEIKYSFLAERIYKGKKRLESISIYSGMIHADDCKFVFKLRKRYLVFAHFRRKNTSSKTGTAYSQTSAPKPQHSPPKRKLTFWHIDDI